MAKRPAAAPRSGAGLRDADSYVDGSGPVRLQMADLDTYTVKIVIGPRVAMHHRLIWLTYLIAATLVFPVVNHGFLGGGWAVDLVGAVFGFLVVSANLQNPSKVRWFDDAAKAAAWVASEEWRG